MFQEAKSKKAISNSLLVNKVNTKLGDSASLEILEVNGRAIGRGKKPVTLLREPPV